MLTMGLETSEAIGGLSLVDGVSLATVRMMDRPLQHAECLVPMIDAALSDTARSRQEIALICVNRGPGSFTGLRIGMAVAKGLAQAIGASVVGVDGTAVYRSLIAEEPRVCVILRSRRDLYYAQWFTGSRARGPVRLYHGNELVAQLRHEQRRLVVIGSGAEMIVENVGEHPWVQVAAPDANRPSPLAVARLGAQATTGSQLFELEPLYVETMIG
jgi:tRNA threonylcarbamoyladenosine biosynthesis protein TsaB